MTFPRLYIISLASLLATACSTTSAPVIDRAPTSKQSSASKPVTAAKTVNSKPAPKNISAKSSDWRPDTHTVKKGDTLFSIGLEYGYDYKDIARANNIEQPYVIRVGQTLKLDTLKDKEPSESKATAASSAQESNNGVTTYPLDTGSAAQNASTPGTASGPVIIREPKALREAYSEENVKKMQSPAKPVAESKIEPATKPADKLEVKPSADLSGLSWSWPTKGKVIANFNEAGNKGIDIAGTKGQAINAAAAGKVIYSGSDLRGYGKLVIIKHDQTYLSVYANNSNLLVKEGQVVNAGQKIAEMGDTDSNIVKLHFEIRQQGKSVDPMKFLTAN